MLAGNFHDYVSKNGVPPIVGNYTFQIPAIFHFHNHGRKVAKMCWTKPGGSSKSLPMRLGILDTPNLLSRFGPWNKSSNLTFFLLNSWNLFDLSVFYVFSLDPFKIMFFSQSKHVSSGFQVGRVIACLVVQCPVYRWFALPFAPSYHDLSTNPPKCTWMSRHGT